MKQPEESGGSVDAYWGKPPENVAGLLLFKPQNVPYEVTLYINGKPVSIKGLDDE